LWVVLALTCSAAIAAESATNPSRRAVPVEGDPFQAQFDSIDPTGKLVLLAGGQRRVLAAAELVYWGDYRDSADRSQVVLADGSVLVAEIRQLAGDAIDVDAGLCGPLKLPLSAVRGLLMDPPFEPLQRDRLLAAVRSTPGADDQLLLDNGDTITGTLKGWRVADEAKDDLPATVLLAAKGRELKIAADTLVAITLNPALVRVPQARTDALELGFRDGSVLQVAKAARSQTTTRLTLVGGVDLELATETLPSELTWVRASSERVTYVSDLVPVGFKHIPLLELSWKPQSNRNALGGRLRSGGQLWTKGLGMHSTSQVAYDLGGRYRRFQAELALDDQAGVRGSVTCRVLFQDPQGQWQRAFESPVVRGSDKLLPISVDVSGVKRMALIVDFADRGDVLDHANWLNARLIQ
jgi:hypothetical protein